VRQELQSVRDELERKTAPLIAAAGLLGGAAVAGAFAGASAQTLLLRLFEKRFGPASAALMATVLHGAAAAALAAAGVRVLRRAAPPYPVETVRESAATVRAATQQRPSS